MSTFDEWYGILTPYYDSWYMMMKTMTGTKTSVTVAKKTTGKKYNS